MPEYYLEHQRVSVDIDFEAQEVRGVTELQLRLPTTLASLPLHCATHCEIESVTLNGAAVDAKVDTLAEEVVPANWQHTRDLGSFRS